MYRFDIPAFEERTFAKNRENKNSTVVTVFNASAESYGAYCGYFEKNGAQKKEERVRGTHSFAAFSCGEDGIFLNFYENIGELYIVFEKNTRYFSYRDDALPAIVSPQITQVTLSDFGMSYAVRLPDGRFIVIDGGNEHDIDSDGLLKTLLDGTQADKVVIASWIFTHPHLDHFHCFLSFMDKYAERVIVEKFMFDFPDDPEKYEGLARRDTGEGTIERMYRHIERTGAPIYTPHTGQRYRIGAAECEILASIDDTVHLTKGLNPTSLVVRMELGGQVLLFCADASFSYARLPEKQGSYLKADILQVPHHGFGCGACESEIEGYELIRPSVCLMPVCDFDAYSSFCTHVESTRHLMLNVGIDEMITGDGQRTLTLPYTACEGARERLKQKYRDGLARCGAYEWNFSDVTANGEGELVFFVTNLTHLPSRLRAELFRGKGGRALRKLELEARPHETEELRIPIVDDGGEFSASEGFFVRFTCSIPVTMSRKACEGR